VPSTPANSGAYIQKSSSPTIPPSIKINLSEDQIKASMSTHNNDKKYPRPMHSPKGITLSVSIIEPHKKEKLWNNFKRSL